MKLIAINGSLRSESFNKQLLEWIRSQNQNKFEMQILDFSFLPLFNPDIELNYQNEKYSAHLKLIAEADGIIFSTPEYIHSIPSNLKNIFDWLVGSAVLDNKKSLAIVAGSSDGQFAKVQLLEIVNVLTNHQLAEEHLIVIAGIKNQFQNNVLVDQNTRDLINSKIDSFINLISKK